MKRLQLNKIRPERNNLSLRKIFKVLQITAFCLLLGAQAWAQGKSISGTVKDTDGNVLPGVTVVLQGTTIGTTSDFDGNFTLGNVPDEATIVVSFVGMKSQALPVGSQTEFDIVLEEDAIGLEEVVAVGYVTRKRGELTGSVSTIKTDELKRTSNTDMVKSLAGKVSGLIVQDQGGYPGAGEKTLLIRGKATLNNNSPLIIIDGMPSGDFSHLSPSDIASLTVLKDGAAAIYGARAANGVIVITTNRGKQGEAKINFSSSYKMSEFTRRPSMMNSEQYATYKNEIAERKGMKLPYSEEDIAGFQNPDNLLYPSTDWFDLTFNQMSPETRNTLTISGGSDNVKYFVSGDVIDQGGLYASDVLSFKRYQVRSNLDIKINDYVKVGIDLSGNRSTRYEPSTSRNSIFKAVYNNPPDMVGIYDNGLIAQGGENGNNPVKLSSDDAGYIKHDNSFLQGKFNINIDLGWITQGLSFNGSSFYNINNEFNKTLLDTWDYFSYDPVNEDYILSQGFIGENKTSVKDYYRKTNTYQLNAQLNYSREFGDHSVKGFVAYEESKWAQNYFSAYATDLLSSSLPDLFAGSNEGLDVDGKPYGGGRANYFGSLAYGYDNKYMVDLTFRYDGSDKFALGHRYGAFPGASLGWVISEENFMDDIKGNWLNNLKLRASWALMGNDRVGYFQYMSRFVYGGTAVNGSQANPNFYTFGTSPVLYDSFYEGTEPNPVITWEKADTKNLGLSFVMFDAKLRGDANYFFQKRTDILVQRGASVPSYVGIGRLPQENFGEVNNFGWEFELAYNDNVGDFNYSFGGNFTNAKNRVVFLDEAENVPEWRKREGHPMDSYIVYPTEGIYRNQDEIDNDEDAIWKTMPGDINYIDTDGDGNITAEDRIRKHTSSVPEIQYGFFGNFEFKGFGLNFLFQGQAKAEIEIFYDNENRPDFWFENRWTPENPDARLPRAFASGDVFNAKDVSYYNPRSTIDVYLFDADFLRLKELELNYTIPSKWVDWMGVTVFARGSNLFTIDKIKWLDPEMPAYNSFRAGMYSNLRTYTFGINVNF